MKTITKIMISMTAALAVCSCGGRQTAETVPAINPENLDTSVAPGQDFYAYATGGWQKNNPLKPEFSRYGAFDVLAENNQIRLNDLFKGLADMQTREGSVERKIADLYTMGLDSLRRNEEGITPILPFIKELDSVTDLESFAKASAECELNGVSSVWAAYATADMMDSSTQVLYIGQSGLRLGNRDYYLLPQHEALRKGYRDYLEKIFTLAGFEDAAVIADDAFGVEMALAIPYWSMVQQRDVQAQYNPMSSEQLAQTYPNLYFAKVLEVLGIAPQEKLIVEQPSYFAAINDILAATDPVKLRHYLQANLLSGACAFVSDEYYTASFEFFSKQMAGAQEPTPLWKRAMSVPNSLLGEAVGKMYVERYFPEENKTKMLEIVGNLKKVMDGEEIGTLVHN